MIPRAASTLFAIKQPIRKANPRSACIAVIRKGFERAPPISSALSSWSRQGRYPTKSRPSTRKSKAEGEGRGGKGERGEGKGRGREEKGREVVFSNLLRGASDAYHPRSNEL